MVLLRFLLFSEIKNIILANLDESFELNQVVGTKNLSCKLYEAVGIFNFSPVSCFKPRI